MQSVVWLRAEKESFEFRTPLTPSDARRLIDAGFEIFVEKSSQRIFQDSEYERVGCKLVEAGASARADVDSVVLNLKVAASLEGPDYWTGFAAAGLALMAWARQQTLPVAFLPLSGLRPFADEKRFVAKIKGKLERAIHSLSPTPTALVIGLDGQAAAGATELFKRAGIPAMRWEQRHIKGSGPYPEIVDYEILVNTVKVSRPVSPFLTKALLEDLPRKLSIVADVAFEHDVVHQVLPIYQPGGEFEAPIRRVFSEPLLDVVAVDGVAAILPRESSQALSTTVWKRLFEGTVPSVGQLEEWKKQVG